jgi:hypothetical protein
MVDLASPSPGASSGDPPGWAVRLVSVGGAPPGGAFGVQPTERRRCVSVTLEYAALGPGPVELRLETVILVYAGQSPLHGLEQRPVLFQDGAGTAPVRLADEPGALLVSPGQAHRGTFVYEFPVECREFRLYFGNCEAIPIVTGM